MLYRYALNADGHLKLRDIRDELLKRGSLQVRASAVTYSSPEHKYLKWGATPNFSFLFGMH
jgi:hypothetical protein